MLIVAALYGVLSSTGASSNTDDDIFSGNGASVDSKARAQACGRAWAVNGLRPSRTSSLFYGAGFLQPANEGEARPLVLSGSRALSHCCDLIHNDCCVVSCARENRPRVVKRALRQWRDVF